MKCSVYLIPRADNLFQLLLLFFVVGIGAQLSSCHVPWGGLNTNNKWVEVEKSPGDRREYRYLLLPNQLQLLLIHDSEARQSAAALNVHAGSRQDPVSRQGLAHFLEHMLFLGTQRYPQADAFQNFISQHGGNYNAYTSFEHTNYYFSIEHDYLQPAIDRFADFFVAPLFSNAYINREVNAVESEYRAKIDEPSRQILEATQQVLQSGHPFTKLSVGNLQTLAEEGIREELLDFFQQHYSAGRMSLVIIGDRSLDELEQMATERFSAIPDNGSTVELLETALFAEYRLPLMLGVKTVKPTRQLHINFPMPDLKLHALHKPLTLLGDVLGHEGEHSLLSALKRRGLAESLSAGMGINYRGGSVFQITANLTDQGLHEVDRVIDAVYITIAKMLDEDPVGLQQRYNELAKLAGMAFRFYEHPSAIATVVAASSSLHFYPAEAVVSGDYTFSGLNDKAYAEFLHRLTPANMWITVASDQLPANIQPDKVTPWYGAEYTEMEVPLEWQQRWRLLLRDDVNDAEGEGHLLTEEVIELRSSISLPAVNAFIPENFELYSAADAPANLPQLVAERPGLELWLQADEEFNVPRVDLRLAFLSRFVNRSIRHQVLANLFAWVINDQLTEFAYPASLAGSQIGFYPHMRGFTLSLTGYSDSALRLLGETLQKIEVVRIEEERFLVLREALLQQWERSDQAMPARRLASFLGTQLFDNNWDYPASIEVLEQISLHDLTVFAERLWPQVYQSALLHGNVSPAMVASIESLLAQRLSCRCEQQDASSVQLVRLEPGVGHVGLALPHGDAAVLWYFQIQDDSVSSVANTLLTTDILQPLFYNQLRTERQLGYTVNAAPFSLHRWPGVRLLVQSPNSSEQLISQEMSAFLQRTLQQPVSEDVFERHKRALIARLSAEDTNLRARTHRYWRALAIGETGFDWQQQLCDQLRQTDYAGWLAFVASTFGADGRSLLLSTTRNPAAEEVPLQSIPGRQLESQWQRESLPRVMY